MSYHGSRIKSRIKVTSTLMPFRLNILKILLLLMVVACINICYMILCSPDFKISSLGWKSQQNETFTNQISAINKYPKYDWSVEHKPEADAGQSLISYMAKYLNVKYEFISNRNGHLGKIVLTNTGKMVIPTRKWQLYMYHITALSTSGGTPMDIDLIEGSLWRLSTNTRFPVLQPGQNTEVTLRSYAPIVSRYYHFPNWYVTSRISKPQTLACTESEDLSHIGRLDHQEQWHRGDHTHPYENNERFILNDVKDLHKAPNYVIPTPAQFSINETEIILIDKSWVILAPAHLQASAQLLADKSQLRFVIEEMSRNNKDCKCIRLETKSYLIEDKGKEAYEVISYPEFKSIVIKANHHPGMAHGIKTFLSVLKHSKTKNNTYSFPQVAIFDWPRFDYRGLMVDVSRNFHSVDCIKKILTGMAMYKLNKLHFHLTDDEGWRIDIPGLPELTQISSKRCHDLGEEHCVHSNLGSGPDPQGLGNGFYTVKEYQEILSHAEKLHIEVIPEIDLPAHGHAAIVAMERRFDLYMGYSREKRETLAREFLLTDYKDRSSYLSVQNFHNNVINICMNSTYAFIEHVVRELVAMHADIQPLRTLHMGGDEVNEKSTASSPECDNLRTRLPHSQSFKEYFNNRLSGIAAQVGIGIQLWEEGVYDTDGETLLPRSTFQELYNNHSQVRTHGWISLWHLNKAYRAYEMANNGYKVVMSSSSHLYLDHPYEPHPDERGLYWSTPYTNTRKLFNYMPLNLYENMNHDPAETMERQSMCRRIRCDQLKAPDNIIGMQGHIWGETVRTDEQLFEMMFPRVLSIAERAWHAARWESVISVKTRTTMMNRAWQNFANTIGYKELRRLDELGFPYKLPVPGISLRNKKDLRINTAFPGLQVQIKQGNATWRDFYNDRLTHGKVMLAARSFKKPYRRGRGAHFILE